MINTYNIIRFVLDISYNDHLSNESSTWDTWLNTVSRIYNHKMPIELLHGLIAKNNPILTQLCNKKIEALDLYLERKSEENENKSNKYKLWELRLKHNKPDIEANRFNVWKYKIECLKNIRDLNKKIEKDNKERIIKEQINKSEENYCNKMKDTWDSKLNDIVSTRKVIENNIWGIN
jgi:hypothetical protein